MIEDLIIDGKVIGKVLNEATAPKYNQYSKLKFFELVGPDVVYAVGRSAKKSLYFMNKLLEASNSIDFNTADYRLLFLSLVQENLITLDKANEIMGAPHE